MLWDVASISEAGLTRTENQDAVCVVCNESAGVFAIADGMGGLHKGGMASAIAAESLLSWWEDKKNSIEGCPFLDLVSSMENAVYTMNRQIYQAYQCEGKQGGTTLCVLFVQGNLYAVLNVGDSRGYVGSHGKFRRLTADDVWENQPNIRTRENQEELKRNPRYGRLTNALGSKENVTVRLSTGELKGKCVFFLCSDGIYKYYKKKPVESQLKKIRKPGDAAKVLNRIRTEVYQNGAKDNLSAIAVLARGQKGASYDKST